MADRATGDSYDPHANRTPEKPVSDIASLVNLVKSAVGTGLFAMPNAFACVGLLTGVVGTILMGLLITVSFQMLLSIHYIMCSRLKKPTLTYDEVVVASLTTSARKPWLSPEISTLIVDVMMLISYIGIGSVYVVFISGTLQGCIDKTKVLDQAYYALLLFPLFFLMNLAKNLHDIAIASFAGNVLLLAAMVIGIVYALKDGLGETWYMIQPDISIYPKFVGTVFFSMASPGVVLALEHNMQNPWNYTKFYGVLNSGMVVITLVHASIGAIGYLKWGSESVGNFIQNHVENDAPTVTALVMQCLAIYFTYGLQSYVPITIFRDEYILPTLEEHNVKANPFVWDLSIRFFVTLVTCLLAASFTKLDLFIGLVGAISMSTLSTIIPVILYILVNHEDYGKWKWKLVVSLILLIIGIFITICAIVINVKMIIESFKNGN